ncbi:hypothetical protein ISF_08273 [Cordyceps fumosorosea ARSEF 2679]|uniref:Uncharacterized protein n=1 Tax=Cordyceps fumosorosea (strain ARSEF 2679) TaxID=1081104 RepID=A0A167MRD4_CORFA|nr:hypothetical protein ISF_08273 [Cordyceps fumosorosea ARSEF 2679]OAA54672.1 hypothetical protein ISF_08273 [Cordyceps fumosorosea ARSEF 2679]
MTPLLAADLTRRVLLALEACVVILATLHSVHAAVTAGRLQSLQCSIGHGSEQDCADSDDTTSLVTSGLALAILSNVVLLARVALLPLRHFPRSVGLLYDVLMATLWLLGLAQLLLLTRATARNVSTGAVVDTDGRVVVTCWRLRGVAVASAAAALYAGRLLFELGCMLVSSEYRPIRERDEWELEKGARCATADARQAYSPVLAFFPDHNVYDYYDDDNDDDH